MFPGNALLFFLEKIDSEHLNIEVWVENFN